MASVLLWAALEKLRQPTALAVTFRDLGLSVLPATAAAVIVPGLELLAAAGLLFLPSFSGTLLLVLLLSLGFAAVGQLALSRGRKLACACFGIGSRAHLGRPQLAALPAWWLSVAILGRPGAEFGLEGAAALAAVGLGLATVRAMLAWTPFRGARDDRHSAKEMYAWLRH